MNMRKKILYILSAIIIFGAIIFWYNKQNSQDMLYYEGKTEELIQNKQPVIVFYWDINCAYCFYSLKFLFILQEVAEKNNAKVVLICSTFSNIDIIRSKAVLIRANIFDLKTAFDLESHYKKKYAITTTPLVMIFDSNGKLVHKKEGYVEWNEKTAQNLVQYLK